MTICAHTRHAAAVAVVSAVEEGLAARAVRYAVRCLGPAEGKISASFVVFAHGFTFVYGLDVPPPAEQNRLRRELVVD